MKKNRILEMDYLAKIEARLNDRSTDAIQKDFPPMEKDEDLIKVFEKTKLSVEKPNGFGVMIKLDRLEQLESILACTGAFKPSELFTASDSKEVIEFCLSHISPHCIIQTKENLEWCLNTAKRSEILNKLVASDELKIILQSKLPQTDEFGELLRGILREGETFKIDHLSTSEKRTLVTVLETLLNVKLSKPNVTIIRSLLPKKTVLTDYEFITKNFTGRSVEVKRLRDFIFSGQRQRWVSMLISGIGGVGKSTILGKVIQDILEESSAVLAVLDFDRPGISIRDTFWLSEEILKQVQSQLDGSMNTERLSWDRFRNVSQSFSSSRQEKGRFYNDLLFQVRSLVLDALGDTKPFVLVFDTVEEIHDKLDLISLARFIDYVSDILSPIQIRVIFSGRVYKEFIEQFEGDFKLDTNKIELEAFDNATARLFLSKMSMNDVEADKILHSGNIPLRPLELKLIAQVVRDKIMTVEELTRDISEMGVSVVDELFSALVYQRVLKRISNIELRKIASPGLVLRYVTPELIGNVIFPAVDKRTPDESTCVTLYNELKNYSWLAYTDNEGRLWHRKDLRRSMLKLMMIKEKEIVEEIRAIAIAYFEANSLNILYKPEVIYHKLMRLKSHRDKLDFTLEELKEVKDKISADFEDLPKPAQSLVKIASEKDLTVTELLHLSKEYFEFGFQKVTERLIRTRQFQEVLDLNHALSKSRPDLEKSTTIIPEEIDNELLFNTCEWTRINIKPKKIKLNDQEEISISQFSEYIFPAGIIEPKRIDRKYLILLFNRFHEGDLKSKLNAGENLPSELIKISYSLINLYSGGKVMLSQRGQLKNLSKQFSLQINTEYQREIFLLRLLGQDYRNLSYTYTLATVPLNPKEITRILKQKNFSANTQKMFHQIMASFNDEQTSRQFLSGIDRLQEHDNEIAQIQVAEMNAEDREELRMGPNLIFRDPSRYAIIDAFSDSEAHRILARVFQTFTPVILTDLEGERFVTDMKRNPASTIETFIEIIDRSWQLGPFLKHAHKLRPKAKKLAKLWLAYQDWDRAALRLLKKF